MIKTQTAVTGGGVRREGGSEEGREEERFLERRGRQDMQKEKEEEKEEGKHRGGLFQTEVVALQGFCTRLCQTEGDRTLAGHFLMCNTVQRSTRYTERNTDSKHVHFGINRPNTDAVIPVPMTHANGDKQLHVHLQLCLQAAIWIQVMKYSFCVATSIATKPWRTLQHVLYVTGSPSFVFFLLLSLFFLASLFC